MLKALDYFHRQIARHIKGRAPVYLRREEQWSYLPLGNSYEEAGIYTVEEYITYRRNGIVDCVASQPLYNLCCSSETPVNIVDHQYWWDQCSF
jgi:hypothetical protein